MKDFKLNKLDTLTKYTTFALLVTVLLNWAIGTSTPFLWLLAITPIFNLHLTTKRSKWFIIPDLIWVIGMIYVAFTQFLIYDLMQYGYYFIIAFVQFHSWSKNENLGHEFKLRLATNKVLSVTILTILLLLLPLGTLAYTLGDPNPFFDALNTSVAFAGAYLLAKRYYHAQYFFLVANMLTCVLYLFRGIPTVSITMLLFLGYTVIALKTWKKGVVK